MIDLLLVLRKRELNTSIKPVGRPNHLAIPNTRIKEIR